MPKKKEKEIIISVVNRSDLQYWCDELGCSKEDLVDAVSKVGCLFSVVKNYLEMNNRTIHKDRLKEEQK